ncbi:MAG: TonB family protein [Halioglobus sp.]
MRRKIKYSLTAAGFAVFATLSILATAAASSDFRIIGLATHQETGREIYLGALQIDKLTPRPENLLTSPGPMMMEYRIVARRTSIRSLLGGMLLQGELASNATPSQSTQDFVGTIMSTVQGSLYSGDQLKISLSVAGKTEAQLNGATLAVANDREVFTYFLNGWLAEQGPSTAFRSAILAPVDSSQLGIFEAHTPTQERIAQTNSWNKQSEPTEQALLAASPAEIETPGPAEEPAVQPAQEVVMAQATVDSTEPLNESLTAESLSAISATDDNYADTSAVVTSPAAAAIGADEEATISEPVQLASITPSSGLLEELDPIDALDVIEYSSRLSTFNTHVLALVTSKVHYPRAAVRRNLQGKLELDLIIASDGSLLAVEIADSSGHSVLDKSAIRAAESALKDNGLGEVDPVAVAEYADGEGNIIVPVPVNFVLME